MIFFGQDTAYFNNLKQSTFKWVWKSLNHLFSRTDAKSRTFFMPGRFLFLFLLFLQMCCQIKLCPTSVAFSAVSKPLCSSDYMTLIWDEDARYLAQLLDPTKSYASITHDNTLSRIWHFLILKYVKRSFCFFKTNFIFPDGLK